MNSPKPFKTLTLRDYCITQVRADYRVKARKAGREWGLTRARLEGLIFSPCAYCGTEASNVFKLARFPDQSVGWNGIDRIDNTLGYLPGNCSPCCKTCNLMKQNHTLSDWLKHIARIIAFLPPPSSSGP